ncbi:Uncharacterised protein [Vibrio cholerae]|nr:hypothetical protein Vc3S01_p20175 [Vibrio campbellii]CRZ54968.1 Uncharacterised protein [Vibrio cholerae]CSB08077.1 Uncharacterised protein [Vibrio cholerae]CSB08755.1 Uncharacterised protein [Vibrio cholerae]CSB10991.1 Uncharacterised protein [Vibrio cholerae]
MLQPPALEKFFKFPLHIARQFLSLLCHKRSECRVILVNDLIEKGLLGSVALVTTSIPIPAGRPGRHMRHVPRPCNTVFTYSLSLSGKFFYPQPKCLPLLDIASQCPSLPVVWAFLWAKHRHDPALNIAVLVDQRLGHEGRVFFGVVVPFPDLVGVKSVGANPPSDWDSDQGAFCLKVGF